MSSRADLLRGLPHRRAFSLAWPAIVASITVPLVGLVDTAMLGHFSDATHLGAVAIGGTVVSAVGWLLNFLRSGTTSLVGRALGGGRTSEAAVHLQRSVLLALALGGAIVVVQWVVVPLLMGVLAPAGEVREFASSYVLIRLLAAPATLLTLVANGWFVGSGDTRRPLAIVATVNVLNIVLDVTFVAGFGWGSQGAAIASAIAEWVGVLVAAALWWRFAPDPVRAAVRRWKGKGLRSGWGRVLSLNGWLFGRTAILYVVLTFVTAYAGRIGEDVLAATSVLMQFMLLASYAQDGYAHAAEAMAAREIGRRDLREFHRANLAAALPAVSIGAVFTLLYLVARDPLIAIMTDLPDVAAAASEYFPWVIALPLFSSLAYLFDGVFLGSGHTRAMMVTMLLCAVAVFFPVLAAGVLWVGDDRGHDLWRAFLLFNVARGVFLGIAYWRTTVRGGWLEHEEPVAA
ncbi:MATE family efflux transporter [Demequina zhanjiangensis]|uniref:MATE family efflux transporter n=1 Tax=Demequina zhanjiangensis TaxID=3051659 RepID=A0ABT8G4U1_9MICO|nr:MATE family efflux transporter [Demequina sp. SYSU T00b26]MDN4474160.1 MATE family efflux transporter [Demequina sp. SYSU T00b26]